MRPPEAQRGVAHPCALLVHGGGRFAWAAARHLRFLRKAYSCNFARDPSILHLPDPFALTTLYLSFVRSLRLFSYFSLTLFIYPSSWQKVSEANVQKPSLAHVFAKNVALIFLRFARIAPFTQFFPFTPCLRSFRLFSYSYRRKAGSLYGGMRT